MQVTRVGPSTSFRGDSSADSASAAKALSSESTSCRNCRYPVDGRFCSQCGQRAHRRLSLRALVDDLLSVFFNLESALARTVVGLTRNPGAVCRDYVDGRRACYVNPLKYCLTILALYLIAKALLNTDPSAAVGDLMITGAGAERALAAREQISRHINLLIFMALPLFTLLLRGYYRRSGFNYAEIAVYALFVLGQIYFFSTLLLPLVLLQPIATAGLRLVIQVGLLTWSAVVFFGGRGVGAWFKALGVQLLLAVSIIPVGFVMALFFLARSGSP